VIPARLLVCALAATTAAGTGLAVNAATAAGPAGGVCTLTGNANFAPNGPGNKATFSYSFTGTLDNCQSSVGGPASGTIEAGVLLTKVPVSWTATDASGNPITVTGTASYQEPTSSGTSTAPNSCANGDTHGTSIVRWADGGVSVIGYDTQSAAAGVVLTGSVGDSVDATLVPGSVVAADGTPAADSVAPATHTISTTEAATPVGNDAGGLLTFQVTDPTQCSSDAGVQTAGITGAVAVGNPTGS
jgi:hypothetical protein